MRVAIGSDHAGFDLKEEIVRFLRDEHIEFKDFGVFSSESSDYPDIGIQVAEAVSRGEFDRGILVCATGIGMSIAANKIPGIRAALCGDVFSARATREHNDSNILTIGSKVTGKDLALEIVKVWLETEFSGEQRHQNRVDKITAIETKYSRGEC